MPSSIEPNVWPSNRSGVDGMAGGAELVGEGVDARGQPLGVMEQQDLGHGSLLTRVHLDDDGSPSIRVR